MSGEGENKPIKSFENLARHPSLASMTVEEIAEGGATLDEKLPKRERVKISVDGKEYSTENIAKELHSKHVSYFNALTEREAAEKGISITSLKAFHQSYDQLKKELMSIQSLEKQGKEIYSGTKGKLETAFTVLIARSNELATISPILATTEKSNSGSPSTSSEQKKSSRAERKQREASISRETVQIARDAAKELLDQKADLRDAFAALDRGVESLTDKETVALLDIGGIGKGVLAAALNKRLSTRGVKRTELAQLEAANEIVGFKAAQETLKEMRKEIRKYESGASPEVILNLFHTFLPSSERFSESLEQYKEEKAAVKQSSSSDAGAPLQAERSLSMSGSATASFGPGEGILKASVAPAEATPEKKGAPETFAEIQAIMEECNARIRTAAAGNPAAIITAKGGKYVNEYRPLLAEIQDILNAPASGFGMYSEKLTDDTVATVTEKLHMLDTLSAEIAEDLTTVVRSTTETGTLKEKVSGAETERHKTFSVPKTITEAQDVLNTVHEYTLNAGARDNPTALVSHPQYKEFLTLLAVTKNEIAQSDHHGDTGELLESAFAATLPEKFEKLFALSDEIIAFLQGQVPASPVATNADILALSKEFREQFRGTKDLEKGRDENGKWYVKEKGKLGEALGAFYTRGLFARIGSGARSLFGINPPGLSPELKAQKSAALEAANAYSASIEDRYAQRLGRKLQAGRIDQAGFDKRMSQFRAMTANRFVLQPVNMLHDAERKALTEAGGGAFGKFRSWYGSLSTPGKIAVGTAVTVGTGVFAGTAAAVIGARAGLKAIMVSTGLGALIGKTTSDFVVGGAQENVRDTIMDIGATYKAKDTETAQAEYMDSLRALDRRKTVAVGAAMAVGAGVAGGGTLLGEHIGESLSGAGAHIPHIDAVQQPSPEEGHDTNVAPAAPEAAPILPSEPHIEVAPNAGHLYHPVTKGDTLWSHTESSFDKELRANFIAGHDRDLVLMNLRERLIQNPDLAQEIGISSGNPDQIEYPHIVEINGDEIPGDTIDDTLLGKLVNEEIAKLTAKIGDPMTQAHAGDPSTLDAEANAHDGDAADQETVEDQPPVPGTRMPAPDSSVMTSIPEPDAITITEAPLATPPVVSSPSSPSIAFEVAAANALGAGAISSLENSRQVGRIPQRAEIEERKADLIDLIEKPKPVSRIGRLFGSFSPAETAPRTPYEVLKTMSVSSIAESFTPKTNETDALKAAREGRKAAFVRENRIDATVFGHWMDNFALWKRIIVGSDTKLADAMTFDTLLEKISEYQLERGETLQG